MHILVNPSAVTAASCNFCMRVHVTLWRGKVWTLWTAMCITCFTAILGCNSNIGRALINNKLQWSQSRALGLFLLIYRLYNTELPYYFGTCALYYAVILFRVHFCYLDLLNLTPVIRSRESCDQVVARSWLSAH